MVKDEMKRRNLILKDAQDRGKWKHRCTLVDSDDPG